MQQLFFIAVFTGLTIQTIDASDQKTGFFTCRHLVTMIQKTVCHVQERLDGTYGAKVALDYAMESAMQTGIRENQSKDILLEIIAEDFPASTRQRDLEQWMIGMFRGAGDLLLQTKTKTARELSHEESIELIKAIEDFHFFHRKLLKNLEHLQQITNPTTQDLWRMEMITTAIKDYQFFIERRFSFQD